MAVTTRLITFNDEKHASILDFLDSEPGSKSETVRRALRMMMEARPLQQNEVSERLARLEQLVLQVKDAIETGQLIPAAQSAGTAADNDFILDILKQAEGL